MYWWHCACYAANVDGIAAEIHQKSASAKNIPLKGTHQLLGFATFVIKLSKPWMAVDDT